MLPTSAAVTLTADLSHANARRAPPRFEMTMIRLLAVALLAVIGALALRPEAAAAHAVPLEYSPKRNSLVSGTGGLVTIRFSEPLSLLEPTDARVVDGDGAQVDTGQARISPANAATLEIPVRGELRDDTYTVSYRLISADSHIIVGVWVFGVGPGPLAAPFFGGAVRAGPSETGGWAVAARFAELAFLGGLFGLIVFTPLVWNPVWRRQPPAGDDEASLVTWGRDTTWTAIGICALGAMFAEAFLLVVYTAQTAGTSVLDAATSTTGISGTLANTRLGELLQIRSTLLFVVFMLCIVAVYWLLGRRAYQTIRDPAATAVTAVLGVLAFGVLVAVSAQGHASQAPRSALQVGADALHLAAVAVWLTGLALVALCLWRLPRLAPSGRLRATQVLTRFSTVALGAVALVLATGTLRSLGELSAPEQLWTTDYGRTLLAKMCLLLVVMAVAARNRRTVNSLTRLAGTSAVGIARVRRLVTVELAIALAVIAVASILVATPPGRTADARDLAAAPGTETVVADD